MPWEERSRGRLLREGGRVWESPKGGGIGRVRIKGGRRRPEGPRIWDRGGGTVSLGYWGAKGSASKMLCQLKDIKRLVWEQFR